MKGMNGNGPGGRVERANKRLGKAVSKLPASRDTPAERREKMASIDKTNAKVAKRVDKLTKVVAKAAQKSDKTSKADKPISLTKTLRGIEKAKPEKPMPKRTQAPLNSGLGTSPVRQGLSALDKFDKRIKISKLEKEAKPAAKAYNAKLKSKTK